MRHKVSWLLSFHMISLGILVYHLMAAGRVCIFWNHGHVQGKEQEQSFQHVSFLSGKQKLSQEVLADFASRWLELYSIPAAERGPK